MTWRRPRQFVSAVFLRKIEATGPGAVEVLAVEGSRGKEDPWDSVRLRTASPHWNVPKKYGPHGEFFFLLKKEPMVLSDLVEFGPCVSTESAKARDLVGLHVMAEENALRSDRDFSLDLGENVEVWLSKKSGLE